MQQSKYCNMTSAQRGLARSNFSLDPHKGNLNCVLEYQKNEKKYKRSMDRSPSRSENIRTRPNPCIITSGGGEKTVSLGCRPSTWGEEREQDRKQKGCGGRGKRWDVTGIIIFVWTNRGRPSTDTMGFGYVRVPVRIEVSSPRITVADRWAPEGEILV